MAEVGAIEVSLRARIDQLEADLRRAEAATKKSSSKMRANFKTMAAAIKRVKANAAAAAGAIVSLSGGAMLNLARQAIRTANDLGDVAQKLGISASALQEFQFAAGQSGVTTEQLNMGLQRFGRRAAEAASGTGAARDAVKQLGLQLRDSNGNLRQTEDLFADTVAALGEIENPLERVRLGFKLFDSEGVAIVNMAGNLGNLREEAQRLGIVLSDEVIAEADSLQDSFDALWSVTKNQLTPALVDIGGGALNATLEVMADLATWANKLYRTYSDISDLGLANAEARIVEEREKHADAIARQERAEESLKKAKGVARGGIGNQLSQARRDRLEAEKAIAELEEHINKLRHDRKVAEEERKGAGGQDLGETEAAAKKAEEERLAAIKERQDLAARAHREYLQQTGQRIQLIQEELDADLTALSENLQAGEDYTEARIELEKTAAAKISAIQDERWDDEQKKLFSQIEKQESVYADLFEFMERGFSDAMATMLLDGELTFKSLAQSFLREFIQMGISRLVTRGFGALASIFNGTAGINPDTGGVFLSPGQTYGPAFEGAFANGGPIMGPALVGERGPELFIPGTSGFIANNQSLRKMGGAAVSPVNVTVINNTGQETSTSERDGPGGQRDIEVMIGAAISKNISRGGDVDQAIRNSYGVQRVGRHGL